MHHRAQHHVVINNRYQVLERLGRGSWGVVWLVEDVETKKNYALKQIFADDDTINSSLRSSWVIRPIMKHPEILEVKEVFLHTGMNPVTETTDRSLCYLMDYHKNKDLRNLLHEKRDQQTFFSEQQICLYMIQLAKGVRHLHEAGLMHRDLKPAHVVVSDDYNQLYISGFGLVQRNDTTDNSGVEGTLKYVAPEIMTDKIHTPAADIWSLGCIFFEIITL
jgi:NIMA (never in mitosis gene a)-related kinase